MTGVEWVKIIETIAAQSLVLGPALVLAYFKAKAEFSRKIDEVKEHTSVSIQKLNGTVSYIVNSFERPAWIKMAYFKPNGQDVEFRMMECNQYYADWFGLDIKDCVGKTDLEAGWDQHNAIECRKSDLAVWASGEPETFTETFDGKKLKIRKIRLQSSDGTLKGIMAYIVDDPEDLQNLSLDRHH
jgi:hypothetical protein